MKTTIGTLKGLLKAGKIEEFKILASQLPCKFSGPFDSKERAEREIIKLVRHPRGPGQVFYIKQQDGHWWVIMRLTTRD